MEVGPRTLGNSDLRTKDDYAGSPKLDTGKEPEPTKEQPEAHSEPRGSNEYIRISLEDTIGVHNMGPMSESAKHRLLDMLNSPARKGTKVKFSIEMEEREKNGRTGFRIDVWETPVYLQGNSRPRGTSTPQPAPSARNSQPEWTDNSAMISPGKGANSKGEKGRARSADDADLGSETHMPSYNEDTDEGPKLPEYGARKEYYQVVPPSDGDISMEGANEDKGPLQSNETNSDIRLSNQDQVIESPMEEEQTDESNAGRLAHVGVETPAPEEINPSREEYEELHEGTAIDDLTANRPSPPEITSDGINPEVAGSNSPPPRHDEGTVEYDQRAIVPMEISSGDPASAATQRFYVYTQRSDDRRIRESAHR